MSKFWAIFRNTFLQTIRQPIYGLLILGTFSVLVLDQPLAGWTMGSDYHATDQKMLENLGLSTLLVSGLLLSAFSASSVLGREIEDKTVLTVVAKPVSRATFVFGKFAGVAAAVAAAFYLCALVFLMTVRHKVTPAAVDPIDWPVIVIGAAALVVTVAVALGGNFVFGWTFTSAGVWSALVLLSVAMGVIAFVGKGWSIVPFGQDIRPQLLVGIAMMFMAVMIFSAVAVAASTRLGQAMTLLICFAVFLAGSMHPFLFGQWGSEVLAVRVLGWIVPNLTYFDPLDALTADVRIPFSVFAFGALYCALYVSAALSVGISLFHGREVESQATSSAMPQLVGLLAWTGRTAAVVVAIAGMVVVSMPRFHTARGFLVTAALLAGGALGWVVWGSFGRGARWAWYVVVVASAAALTAGIANLATDWRVPIVPLRGPGRMAYLVAAAAVFAILLLPKTLHHFNFRRRGAGGAGRLPHPAGTGSTRAR